METHTLIWKKSENPEFLLVAKSDTKQYAIVNCSEDKYGFSRMYVGCTDCTPRNDHYDLCITKVRADIEHVKADVQAYHIKCMKLHQFNSR